MVGDARSRLTCPGWAWPDIPNDNRVASSRTSWPGIPLYPVLHLLRALLTPEFPTGRTPGPMRRDDPAVKEGRRGLSKLRRIFGEPVDDIVIKKHNNRSHHRLVPSLKRRSRSNCIIHHNRELSRVVSVRFQGVHARHRSSHHRLRSHSAPPTTSPRPTRHLYKSCLRPRPLSSTAAVVEKSEHDLDAILLQLKRGLYLLKHKANGTVKKRFFRLSADCSEVVWGKSPSRISGSMNMAEVHAIVMGPRTPGFSNFDWNTGVPWLCLSVIGEKKYLDFECSKIDEVRSMITGLQSCAPLSYEFMNYGRMLWVRCIIRAIQMARRAGIYTLDVFRNLEVKAKMEARDRRIQSLIVACFRNHARVPLTEITPGETSPSASWRKLAHSPNPSDVGRKKTETTNKYESMKLSCGLISPRKV
uniref:PH domain-containing protein n=1 Tax=Spongospora subterranea TaxID=70186 RepID=A0A0H5QH66_9EUKA|eukprot:CRZ01308.1 hypothetical protein [Spongospora subterranea]